MRLHEIILEEGSARTRKRVGRGRGSGHGKTSGRGQKGQKSRSGASTRPGFEGGQMPLFRKLPRRGFNNARFRNGYLIINLSKLDPLGSEEIIDRDLLQRKGLVRDSGLPLKILGQGELTCAIRVRADKFSVGAREKIEKAGGQALLNQEVGAAGDDNRNNAVPATGADAGN